MRNSIRQAAKAALDAWDTRAGIGTASAAFEMLREALADEAVDWEAVAADQAMTIAMLQVEISELKEKINVQRFP